MLTFLWCVPRSVSTAFEKMMLHAGEFEVISEPFLDLYKYSLISEAKYIEAGQRIREYCEELIERSSHNPIFVKDMAYHADAFITNEFIDRAKHVFLIRDPMLSVPSLYRMRPEYTEDQTGFAGQLALLNRVTMRTDRTPLIIDAEVLLSRPSKTIGAYFNYLGVDMPEGVLAWPRGSNNAWHGRESWHTDAIESQGFEARSREIDLEKLPKKVLDSISLATPIYREMYRQSQ